MTTGGASGNGPGTTVDLLDGLRSGRIDLLEYLDRLEVRFAEEEPLIFAFVPEPRRWERLAHEARDLLAAYPNPAGRPPLFGLLVGVKDIFHVDGQPTRAGSRVPPVVLAGPEAAAVTALKRAGALIAGKTITTEFAWFGPGPTRNPHNPFHTPGGSSSGSAAAVAAGLVPIALGSQTIGSINRPAAFCGVIGFKPTYNRISKAGVIELATSHDHAGLFAADLAGAARLAAVLCAGWQPAESPADVTLGMPQGPYLNQAGEIGLDHFGEVCDRLRGAGIAVRPVPAMPNFEEIRRQHLLLNAAEAAHYHASLADFHELYHPRTRELIQTGVAVGNEEMAAARAAKADTRAHLESLLDRHRLDAWITPAAPGPAPPGLESTGDPVMQLPFTNAGLPMISLPSGRHKGLPLGTQLIGRWQGDEQLFAVAEKVARALQSIA